MAAEPPEQWLADVVLAAASAGEIGVAVSRVVPTIEHLFLSEHIVDLVGHTVEDLRTKGPLVSLEPADRERIRAAVAQVANGRHPEVVRVNVRREDGGVVNVEAMPTVQRKDAEVLVTSFLFDVSRRRRVEASLAATDDQLVDILDKLPDPVFATASDRVVYANRALRDLLRVEGLLGDPQGLASEISMADPDVWSRPAPTASGGLREVTLGTSAGRTATLEARATHTELRGVEVELWFCRDMTERKQVEDELMQADRLATLGTLAGGLAHAINNPLSSVALNLEDLVRRMPELAERPELRAGVEERLTLAKEAADRVAQVVAQLRVFSRMRKSAEVGDVDVRRVVEDGIELVANEIRHRGQLQLALRPVPAVRGIEGRVEHALLTLLIFSVRMLPDRPGGLSRLSVETGFDARHVDVVVRCDGRAPDSAASARQRNPFAPRGPRERGLGLAICNEIVQSMDGQLDVQIGEDSSTFSVRLPRVRADVDEERGTEPMRRDANPAGARRARVLVIDDDPGVLSALRLMLQDDHDVTVMQNPREALTDIASGADYDIVFCDFTMPEMTGADVFEAVRGARPGYEMRIVFMTGASFQTDAERFLESVDNLRIDKPFNLERAEALLRRAGH